MNNQALVSVSHVFKSYGTEANKTDALRDVSLEVNAGEFITVMGPSGCGKSTLLYLIGGLDAPTSGTILLSGKNIASMSDKEQSAIRCRDLGFVFQFFNLVQNLTVEENVLLPLVMAGEKVSAPEKKKRFQRILGDLGLKGKENAFPSELSGGQQQRVSIARALMGEPKLILADEPTGSLDSKNSEATLKLLQKVNREYGVSVLMVTHAENAASYGTRLIRMCDGAILQDTAIPQKNK